MREAAITAAANEFIESENEKYDAPLQQNGTNLSGGQRQRLSIARALIRKPKILILDDSSSAVDAKTEAIIKNNLNKIKDTTIIIVAQKISSIIDCDRIIVIDSNGQIDAFGKHDDIINTSIVYQEIYNSQAGSMNRPMRRNVMGRAPKLEKGALKYVIKRIWEYIKQYPGNLTVVIFSIILTIAFNLAVPFIIQYFIDKKYIQSSKCRTF